MMGKQGPSELKRVETRMRILKHISHENSEDIIRFFLSFPEPAWVKDVIDCGKGDIQFPMIFTNDAYEDLFGISAFDYKGMTDEKVWKLSDFENNDVEVYRRREHVWAREEATLKDGSTWSGWVIKWAIPNEVREITAIAGIALAWTPKGQIGN